MMVNRTFLYTILIFATAAALSSCYRDPERRELQFMPDMYRNPAVKAQESYAFFKDGSGMRMPPEGAVSVGYRPYPYDIAEREKARVLENPLEPTRENFMLGKKYFNIHCRPCHGVVGSGDGLVTQVHRENGMPVPPSLYSDKIRGEWYDGEIFHVITKGQGQMYGYESRISVENRWAIVHYVRALGEAANPSPEDLEVVAQEGINVQEVDDPYREFDVNNQLYLGTMDQKY